MADREIKVPSEPLPPTGKTQRERDYDAGWIECTRWAGREDLLADMDSGAYVRDRYNALALSAAASPPQALSEPLKETARMLTDEELILVCDEYFREPQALFAKLLQRKFCEVNAGRVIPVSPEGGG